MEAKNISSFRVSSCFLTVMHPSFVSRNCLFLPSLSKEQKRQDKSAPVFVRYCSYMLAVTEEN